MNILHPSNFSLCFVLLPSLVSSSCLPSFHFFSLPLLNLLHTAHLSVGLSSSSVAPPPQHQSPVHVCINLPTIVPLNHHWDNLATNILNRHTLHSRDNMAILSPACHSHTLHMHGKFCTLIPELIFILHISNNQSLHIPGCTIPDLCTACLSLTLPD